MFKNIKKKIKLAKISAIVFGIVFIALIINSICLTIKVHKLEKKLNNNYGTEHICSHEEHTKQQNDKR